MVPIPGRPARRTGPGGGQTGAVDLRQLAALAAVADHRSFSAAAQALHTVQSNVSTHVAKLERELGVTLVDRATGELTDGGRAVVERARRIQAELTAIPTDLANLAGTVSGPVRLGMIGTVGAWVLPLLIPAIARDHPAIDLAIDPSGEGLSFESTRVGLTPSSAWENGRVGAPSAAWVEGQIVLLYEGGDGEGIGLTASADGAFTNAASPVIVPGDLEDPARFSDVTEVRAPFAYVSRAESGRRVLRIYLGAQGIARPASPGGTFDQSNLSIAAVGAYLDDDTLLACAAERWKEFVATQIAEDGHLTHEVGRNHGTGDHGLWYSHFSLMPQTLAGEILRLRGVDLFDYVAPNGRTLRMAYERLAPWARRPETFPYYHGDPARLGGARYVSYYEILHARWPHPDARAMLEALRPLTATHSAPHLTFTHGEPLGEADR